MFKMSTFSCNNILYQQICRPSYKSGYCRSSSIRSRKQSTPVESLQEIHKVFNDFHNIIKSATEIPQNDSIDFLETTIRYST